MKKKHVFCGLSILATAATAAIVAHVVKTRIEKKRMEEWLESEYDYEEDDWEEDDEDCEEIFHPEEKGKSDEKEF